MPSYEDVTTRAGSVRAMTGFTEPAFEALLPPFEHALMAYLQDLTMDGNPAPAAAIGRMTMVLYPP